MLRLLARIIAITILTVVAPVAIAAATTHYMLEGSDWTDPVPAKPTTRPAPPAAPEPEPTAGVRWDLGTCLTTKLRPADCRPGVWQLVAVVPRPGPDPCKGVTSHPETRYAHGLALCLTRY